MVHQPGAADRPCVFHALEGLVHGQGGRVHLLNSILKLALALLPSLLPCCGSPGLLASKPQVSRQRSNKWLLALGTKGAR